MLQVNKRQFISVEPKIINRFWFYYFLLDKTVEASFDKRENESIRIEYEFWSPNDESIDQITIIKIHQRPNADAYIQIKIIIINKRKEKKWKEQHIFCFYAK